MKILGKFQKLIQGSISGISDFCYCFAKLSIRFSKLSVRLTGTYAQYADKINKQQQFSGAVRTAVTSNGDQKKHFVTKFKMLHITPISQIEV